MTSSKKNVPLISGDALRADTEADSPQEAHWFWIGVLPNAPFGSCSVGGICFPKKTLLYSRDRSQAMNGRAVKTAMPGEMLRLSREKIERIAAKLPQRIVRFFGPPSTDREGENVGTPGRRQTTIVQRPTDEERAAFEKHRGRPLPDWRKQDGDTPLSDFLYLQYVGGWRPKPKSMYDQLPECLSITGISAAPLDAKPAATDGGLDYPHGNILGKPDNAPQPADYEA